jgi:hypothetical protein
MVSTIESLAKQRNQNLSVLRGKHPSYTRPFPYLHQIPPPQKHKMLPGCRKPKCCSCWSAVASAAAAAEGAGAAATLLLLPRPLLDFLLLLLLHCICCRQ